MCSGCGHPKAESMAEENDGAYEVTPVTCFACAAKDAEQRSVSERIDTPESRRRDGLDRSAVDGTYIIVTKKKGG